MAKYLVIGGTGTLGKAFIEKAVSHGHAVTCFSRCELKQKELQASVKGQVKCVIGDVRDRDAVMRVTRGFDSVFLFAALKHVDTLEFNPEEAFKTNVIGTVNALDAAEQNGVKNFVFSSTDKAVDPVNAYGYSKALAEKIIQARTGPCTYKVYRWGNVISSRGSVIPMFIEQLKKSNEVRLTDTSMTRFLIKIHEVVNFIFDTFELGTSNEILIPSIKAASIQQLVRVIASLLGVKNYKTNIMGIRPGEKLHETLVSAHIGAVESCDPKYAFTDSELADYLAPIILGESIKPREQFVPKILEARYS
tara:strand:- start:8454 stop:9371 length:918 start_codon:yes stop_codon:yes gene_type:complete